MQKRLVKLIFVVFVVFLYANTINAEDINCDYENEIQIQYSNGNVVPNIDSLNKWYNITSVLFDSGKSASVSSDEITLVDQEKWKENLGINVCPQKIYVCEEITWGIEHPNLYGIGASITEIIAEGAGLLIGQDLTGYYASTMWSLAHLNKKHYYLMTETTYKNEYSSKEGYKINFVLTDNISEGQEACTWGDGNFFGGVVDVACGTVWGIVGTVVDTAYNPNDQLLYGTTTLSCYGINYPQDGPYLPINASCPQVQYYDKLLDKQIEEYKNCGNDLNCKTNKKISIKQTSEPLRNLCSDVLRHHSYVGEQKECIDQCLNLNDKLSDVEVYSNGRECGISQKLALYISNIVKWAKYIVPVIVIVLGILDFIKAISADKDDEMKKSQGRFVKRLIAAALIFIIPFIIEFILDKMGFGEYISGCGIDVGL